MGELRETGGGREGCGWMDCEFEFCAFVHLRIAANEDRIEFERGWRLDGEVCDAFGGGRY